MLVLSISTDHEKAVMVQSDCELGTTSAGGMAESRIASFQCKARTLAATSVLLISSVCGTTVRVRSSTLVHCGGVLFKRILAEITAFQYASLLRLY